MNTWIDCLYGSNYVNQNKIESIYLYRVHAHLINIISSKSVLTKADIALCHQYFEPVHYAKNSIIEEERKVPQYLYFIVSGYLRLFSYNANGGEVTTHINCPPGFITAYFNFQQQTKAEVNLECITDCNLLRITKTGIDLLIEQSPAFNSFSMWVFQQAMTYNENRAKDLATLSAEERYKKLLEYYPEIIQNVPLQYIASFLGMNAKSLSRIRKQIIK